jgi:hypothetical protein
VETTNLKRAIAGDATREEIDGADSQDEPKTMKDAAAEQRLRSPSGRVRNTLAEPRERLVGGARNGRRKTIGRATTRNGRP